MYTRTDPRSNLAAATGAIEIGKGFAASEYARFYETQPDEVGPGTRTWYARGQNFIVAYSEVASGASLARAAQADEYVMVVHDPETTLSVTAPGEQRDLAGGSLTIMPPGASSVILPRGGKIIRLFTTRSADLAAKCSNAAAYAEPHPHIPPLELWPAPPGGYRVRSYSLDVPDQPGRFGKIWRCTTFMVNVFAPVFGARDPRQLSPHHHDDFEQCSLVAGGGFMHHIRWPWTTDLHDWRADEHEYCGTPSIVVIPPRAIHTTAAVDEGPNLLVDIFSPPRADFSKMAGWVLNADEYPAP